MKTLSNHRADRLTLWIATYYDGIQAKFIDKFDLNQGEISQMLLKKRVIGEKKARKLEEQTDIPPMWLDASDDKANLSEPTHSNARRAGYVIEVAHDDDDDFLEIPYYYAKGSCGGGAVNYEDTIKGHLRKEKSWFKKYQVNRHDLATIYADGDSMANYIVHGDMLIFDKSKTQPISGEVFLINHPDGERVKRLRRAIDGTWILESDNPDKKRYPDEQISPDQGELLRIIGQLIYRQGL